MSNIPYNRDVELKTAHARIRELEAALRRAGIVYVLCDKHCRDRSFNLWEMNTHESTQVCPICSPPETE